MTTIKCNISLSLYYKLHKTTTAAMHIIAEEILKEIILQAFELHVQANGSICLVITCFPFST